MRLEDCWKNLAVAVLKQANKDYRQTMRNISSPKCRKADYWHKRAIENFYESQWCSELKDLISLRG